MRTAYSLSKYLSITQKFARLVSIGSFATAVSFSVTENQMIGQICNDLILLLLYSKSWMNWAGRPSFTIHLQPFYMYMNRMFFPIIIESDDICSFSSFSVNARERQKYADVKDFRTKWQTFLNSISIRAKIQIYWLQIKSNKNKGAQAPSTMRRT